MARADSEKIVEDKLISDFQKLDYEFIPMKDYFDVENNFRIQLCKLNAPELIAAKGKAELSDKEFQQVLTYLEGKTVFESAKILRDKQELELDNGKHVFLDFISEYYERNIFQVTHQITMDKEHCSDVLYKNRYDVTVLINGLPLIQIEVKKPGVEINEAINQINRYRKFSFKKLFRYIQIFIVSNKDQTKYMANTNEIDRYGKPKRLLKSLAFYWTDENNKRINKLSEFVNDFMQRYQITEMLTKFMVLTDSDKNIMIMRPYQVYAVKKAIERVINCNMNGYIFHTTGSGKTLTSFKLAQLLRKEKSIEKIFFLVDRKDLDDQTVDEYNKFEKDCVDTTDSTYQLVKDLKDSSKKLIITTIQKMANALRNPKYSDVLKVYETKKCVFIIDECHRSQFGKMHGDIKRHFKNSKYIGFTGTPIFKENAAKDERTTADQFYAGSLNPCIHKYMIKEAIADGNVLRFSVEYMKSITPKNVPEIEDIDFNQIDDIDYCHKKHIDADKIYHDPERIKFVAQDILKNLDKHVRPGNSDVYTAIFAVDKIQTLMQYYHEFKKINKTKRIAAIFTYAPNDNFDEGHDKHSQEYLQECIDDYNKTFGTSFDISSFDAYRKDISKRMKQKDIPQIDLLLVVNMFLTGFDSKVTNTLILDKNLVYQSLVQAYSRTNRVDKESKQFGQIITYRNIKKAQDDALKLFSGSGNPNDYLLESYEFYVRKYISEAQKVRKICPAPEDAGERMDEEKQKEFVLAFRDVACTLAILKTFSKFDWKDIEDFLDDNDFQSYKSWYTSIYDELKKQREKGAENILLDVDFKIELIRTDKINVIYIVNLLKEVDKNDNKKMQEAIDLILREIERSDNEKLKSKKDLLINFIKTKFLTLKAGEDVEAAYELYEAENMRNEIRYFCSDNKLKPEDITGFINDYISDTNAVTKEKIRKQLQSQGKGLLETTILCDKIYDFMKEIEAKYTAEK